MSADFGELDFGQGFNGCMESMQFVQMSLYIPVLLVLQQHIWSQSLGGSDVQAGSLGFPSAFPLGTRAKSVTLVQSVSPRPKKIPRP